MPTRAMHGLGNRIGLVDILRLFLRRVKILHTNSIVLRKADDMQEYANKKG